MSFEFVISVSKFLESNWITDESDEKKQRERDNIENISRCFFIMFIINFQ